MTTKKNSIALYDKNGKDIFSTTVGDDNKKGVSDLLLAISFLLCNKTADEAFKIIETEINLISEKINSLN